MSQGGMYDRLQAPSDSIGVPGLPLSCVLFCFISLNQTTVHWSLESVGAIVPISTSSMVCEPWPVHVGEWSGTNHSCPYICSVGQVARPPIGVEKIGFKKGHIWVLNQEGTETSFTDLRTDASKARLRLYYKGITDWVVSLVASCRWWRWQLHGDTQRSLTSFSLKQNEIHVSQAVIVFGVMDERLLPQARRTEIENTIRHRLVTKLKSLKRNKFSSSDLPFVGCCKEADLQELLDAFEAAIDDLTHPTKEQVSH